MGVSDSKIWGLGPFTGAMGINRGIGAYMHMDICFLFAGEVSLIQGSPCKPLEGALGFRDI